MTDFFNHKFSCTVWSKILLNSLQSPVQSASRELIWRVLCKIYPKGATEILGSFYQKRLNITIKRNYMVTILTGYGNSNFGPIVDCLRTLQSKFRKISQIPSKVFFSCTYKVQVRSGGSWLFKKLFFRFCFLFVLFSTCFRDNGKSLKKSCYK